MADDTNKSQGENPTTENLTPANEAPASEISTPTQANEQLNLDSEAPATTAEAPPTDKAPEEATAETAALAKDTELANAETPSTEKTAPETNDKVINYNFNAKNQTLQKNSSEAQDKTPQNSKVTAEKPEKPPPRRGRPPSTKQTDNPDKTPKAEKSEKSPKPEAKPKPEKPTKEKTGATAGGGKTSKTTGEEKPKSAAVEKAPEAPTPPPEPTTAPRTGEQEKIVYINLTEIHPFKDHPFQVKEDAEMTAMVESVRDKGVTQPAILRPREEGGYEMVSGHRRHKASELANYTNMPCIVRNLTDEQAITQMVEDNTNQRESILPSERGAALKMQLEAIKRQGARDDNGGTKGQRSNEIVAERNGMTYKQVQRYIKLTELVPDLSKMVDEKKIAFTPAVELAHIKSKNQNYIAVSIEGNSAPSLSQAQKLRELDKDGKLNPDIIDGILMEDKKEVDDKVILSSKELAPFFGNEKTPREMKDTILKLLNEHKVKNPPELGKTDKPVKPPER